MVNHVQCKKGRRDLDMRSYDGGAWRAIRDQGEHRARRGGGLGHRVWLLAFLGALIILPAGCSEEGQERIGDALESVTTTVPDESVPRETPAPTEAPEPQPTTAPVTEQPAGQGDGMSSSDWLLLILLGVAAVALIATAISAAGRYSASKLARKSAISTRIGDIVGASRWIHDSGSMEVLLVQNPSQVQLAWAPVRTRMMDIESQVSTLAATIDDDDLEQALHDLGQALTGLRSVQEAYVGVKTRSVGYEGDQLLQSSYQTVIDSRRGLQMAIDPVAIWLRSQ